MLMETVILRFPNPDTAPIEIESSHISALKKDFMDQGRIIKATTLRHPNKLTRISVRLFRDQESYESWWNDPIVQARVEIYKDYYTKNQISFEIKIEPI